MGDFTQFFNESDGGQIFTVVFSSINLFFILAANILMLFNRNVSAVRSKSLPFTTLANIGGFCFTIGVLFKTGAFGFYEKGDAAWILLGLLLGGGLVLTSFVGLFYQLFIIFVQGKSPQRHFLTYVCIIHSPIVIACIVDFADNGPTSGLHLIWAFVYVAAFWYLAFRLRHIRKEYNEYKTTCIGAALTLYLLLSIAVGMALKVGHVPKEYYESLAPTLLMMYFFWTRCWKVVFTLVFRDRSVLEKWVVKYHQRSIPENINKSESLRVSTAVASNVDPSAATVATAPISPHSSSPNHENPTTRYSSAARLSVSIQTSTLDVHSRPNSVQLSQPLSSPRHEISRQLEQDAPLLLPIFPPSTTDPHRSVAAPAPIVVEMDDSLFIDFCERAAEQKRQRRRSLWASLGGSPRLNPLSLDLPPAEEENDENPPAPECAAVKSPRRSTPRSTKGNPAGGLLSPRSCV